MKTYLFTGLLEPNNDENPLCTLTEKSNCCTRQDIKDMYENYTKDVLPRLTAFFKKFKQSLGSIEDLRLRLMKVRLPMDMIPQKVDKCKIIEKLLFDFKFEEMIKALLENADSNFMQFKRYHQSFYCILCDKTAHSQIDMSNRSMNIDLAFCLNNLRESRKFLKAMNIELVNYFMLVQHYLDCAFFDDYYNFNYLYKDKEKLRAQFNRCYEDIQPNEFCQAVCLQMTIGGMSPGFEGDYAYIQDSVNYYSELINQIEVKQSKQKEVNPTWYIEQLNA